MYKSEQNSGEFKIYNAMGIRILMNRDKESEPFKQEDGAESDTESERGLVIDEDISDSELHPPSDIVERQKKEATQVVSKPSAGAENEPVEGFGGASSTSASRSASRSVLKALKGGKERGCHSMETRQKELENKRRRDEEFVRFGPIPTDRADIKITDHKYEKGALKFRIETTGPEHVPVWILAENILYRPNRQDEIRRYLSSLTVARISPIYRRFPDLADRYQNINYEKFIARREKRNYMQTIGDG